MKCPTCAVDLTMSERQGIEIDYCPKCRGVWLDRGELDKIIERAAGDGLQANRSETTPYRDDDDWKRQGGYPRKRGGWLSDLFD